MSNYFETTDVLEIQRKVRELNNIISKTFTSKISLTGNEVEELKQLLNDISTTDGIIMVQTPTGLGPVTSIMDGSGIYHQLKSEDTC